jgi:hypothetical protein
MVKEAATGVGRMGLFSEMCRKCNHQRAICLYCQIQATKGELIMRALIVCAIVITAAVGLGGCFHHAQAVTQQPLKLG